jgi:hypothetical protein
MERALPVLRVAAARETPLMREIRVRAKQDARWRMQLLDAAKAFMDADDAGLAAALLPRASQPPHAWRA